MIVAMFVLSSCAHKHSCKMKMDNADAKATAHVCTAACDHSAEKAMAADHVCTAACDHADHATMAKEHKCTEACTAECKAAHMEKHGADHVCTDACAADCKMKTEQDAEGMEGQGNESQEGGAEKG